ncbi:DUF6115 domain-containing protein [Ornithinibacillus bavariensis]|uniref:Swarming motility protein SwrB n=1 Tax=Ornithinibacillus bavariensis TaxID=545502 RepID=A0A919X5M9_9BACI|nr:hypothetical protein [Ornithinibacillus bavariensis]GIO26179.1 swarming motility protein SwrB [Ornithinibacillus bavariensis]HAM79419.1 hypothetical protein [Ornithinibacillus sp.]
MTSFLLIISFLLHIISITAIYALSKQLRVEKKNDTTEIVALMESYLEEIKEENKMLQDRLAERDNNDSSRKHTTVMQTTLRNEDVKEVLPFSSIEDEPLDQVEVSLQSKILKLHKEGLSPEDIARELSCGKTEVELIIKFHEEK